MTTPITIAVIGFGPSGMFFCHALEHHRRDLTNKGDQAGLAALPIVTCFERAPGPGGVWRSERSFTKHDDLSADNLEENKNTDAAVAPSTANMYEALWTNGPKETIEFFDYTFDEHFGHALPVYVQREAIQEYIVARCTKNCPDFLEKYAKFSTSVDSVKYIDERKKFEVVIKDMVTEQLETQYYDKCIWAAGDNGRPHTPENLVQMFRSGGFTGRMIHSSDTCDFESDVKGKRVLLLGGEYSAEDLALMAVKVGVEKVYVVARADDGMISYMSAWPKNKVEVIEEMAPIGVAEDGTCIELAYTTFRFPDSYENAKKVKKKIRNIDTIIFCTGYKVNVDMLDADLSRPLQHNSGKISVPHDWKMKPNKLTPFIGEVTPGDVVLNKYPYYTGVYRGLSISNPSMMFVIDEYGVSPLVALDVSAWMLMRFVTGSRQILSAQEMIRQNEEDCFDSLKQDPFLRYLMDSSYFEAFNEAHSEHEDSMDPIYEEDELENETSFACRRLARLMEEAKYPVSYGTYDELNEIAKTLLKYEVLSTEHRATLDPDNESENEWRTFRDCKDAHLFRSIFTGTEAVSLKQRWLDIDAHDASTLES